jgi:DeoR-like helix-turn-helix domain
MALKLDLAAVLAEHRKVSVQEAAEINNVSPRTFRRRYPHLIQQISFRRQAVNLKDALAIGKQSESA